jgi:threonine/homoserine/homoserine lactone efflux protein
MGRGISAVSGGLGAFLVVATVVVITPGVDMALVTRNASRSGRRAAVLTALGMNLGVLFWAIAAALGLAAMVAASAAAFAAIKLAGAVYLVYLGLVALRSARRGGAQVASGERTGNVRGRASFREGLVSNLLNPKIAVFFTSLLPQCAGAGASTADLLLLGLLFNTLGVAWLTSYAVVATRGRNLLSRRAVKRTLDRATGIVLIGLGARLALERRP